MRGNHVSVAVAKRFAIAVSLGDDHVKPQQITLVDAITIAHAVSLADAHALGESESVTVKHANAQRDGNSKPVPIG